MKRLTPLLSLLLALIPAGALAQAASPEIVREIFTCGFKDGKNMSDLMAARDFYVKQMQKAGMPLRNAFLWTPFKAAVDFDFLWAVDYPDMMTFAKESDAYLESAEGRAADERFTTVATCTSLLATRREFFAAGGEVNLDPGRGAVINAGACNYRRGHGEDDLDDLVGHLGAVMTDAGLADGSFGYVSVPAIGGGPQTSDFYVYGLHPNLEAWAARGRAMNAAEGIGALRRHFRTIAQCRTGLFFGRQVVPAQ